MNLFADTSSEVVAGVALVLVALVGLAGTIIQGRKTRRLGTEEHATNGVRSEEILKHLLHIHDKVDGVNTKVDGVNEKVAEIGDKVAVVAKDLHTHLTEMNTEIRTEAGFMEERMNKPPVIAVVAPSDEQEH